MTDETDNAPAMELDFGIGRIYVKGDEETSFDEVVEEFNRQKDDMTGTIEDLKEFDYELRERYDTETPQGPSFS